MALRRLGVGGLWLGVFGVGVGRCLGVAICVGRNWGLGLEWSLLFYFPLDLILWSLWCWLWWVVLGGLLVGGFLVSFVAHLDLVYGRCATWYFRGELESEDFCPAVFGGRISIGVWVR